MNMRIIEISEAIKLTANILTTKGYEVKTEKWQGVENPPAMWEALNVTVQAGMPHSIKLLANQCQPNLPWAEDHFQERVQGTPLNPGEQYKNWPFYKRDDEMRSERGQFSHTYMERFWPRVAGKVSDHHCYNDQANTGAVTDNFGIRYYLGDLNDLINLLQREPNTRQAYLPVWFPEDTGVNHGGRVPCTLGYHFMVRHDFMHMVYYIRSCDFIRHFNDDIYLAVRLAQHILWKLRAASPMIWNNVELGTFTMHITSLHCFLPEVAKIKHKYDTPSKPEDRPWPTQPRQ